MEPLMSIIMPVYNNEIHFPKAVGSVLSQEFKDFELIIVDDGSTDDTPNIADRFADSDKRVRVIHQENQWIYKSISNGLLEARGEYAYFLNSDDRLRPNSLQVLAGIAEKHNPDVVWTIVVAHRCDENQNIVERNINNMEDAVKQDLHYSNAGDIRRHLLFLFKYHFAVNQANLYRTSIARSHPMYTEYVNADQIFNLSIAPDLSTAYICSAPIYDHYLFINNQNLSRKYHALLHEMYNKHYSEFVRVFKTLGVFDDEAESYIVRERFNAFFTELGRYNSHNCDLSAEDKIRRVFTRNIDELVYGCARKLDEVGVLEREVLLFCIEIFSKTAIDPGFEYYFIFEMLGALYGGGLPPEAQAIIDRGIRHELNPFNIGKYTYDEIRKSL